MTNLQRLALRASEIRERLNELGAVETRSAEQDTELDALTTEYAGVERSMRAFQIASDESMEAPATEPEPDESSETREREALIERADIADVFGAAIERRDTSGATRELQTEFGLMGHQIPLDMLRTRETRDVTPAATSVGVNQQQILQPVFPDAAARYLNIPMPRVPVGDALFPVLGSGPTVGGPHTDSTKVSETTGAFTVTTLQPGRIQASYFFRRSDTFRMRGMAESLRNVLGLGLRDAFDKYILVGANGLLTGTNLADNAASAKATYANFMDALYGRVDGRYASMSSQIKTLFGNAVYTFAGSLYNGQRSDYSALEDMMKLSGGVQVSAHVPAVASKKQESIYRIGMRRDAVAPIWEGVTLINDEVTKAATGEIVITAVMMVAFKIIRKAGFHKQEFQTS